MLAEGIDPIASKQQAKAEAVVRCRTFERVSLDWHKEMSVKWAPGHLRTVLSRLKIPVFPLLGARAIVDLDIDVLRGPEADGKFGGFDKDKVAERFKARPDLLPHTLADCLCELDYWNHLY